MADIKEKQTRTKSIYRVLQEATEVYTDAKQKVLAARKNLDDAEQALSKAETAVEVAKKPVDAATNIFAEQSEAAAPHS